MAAPGGNSKFYIRLFAAVLLLSASLYLLSGSISGLFSDKVFREKLDAVLPSSPEAADLSSTYVGLSAIVDPEMDKKWTCDELNRLSEGLKVFIGDEADPELIIKKYNDYFFDTLSFRYDEKYNALLAGKQEGAGPDLEDAINYESAYRVLKSRHGICLSLSMIYLVMAEKLKIPIYGVVLPGHFHVRYQDNSHSSINAEPTSGGSNQYNNFEYFDYKGRFGIETIDENRAIYNKTLSKYETIGVLLNNFSDILIRKGEYRNAKLMLEKSVLMAPGLAESHDNLGLVLYVVGDRAGAEAQFNAALAILPEDKTASGYLEKLSKGGNL
jgi:regulator of sirC expression with transglutaminase-like and TPR domain